MKKIIFSPFLLFLFFHSSIANSQNLVINEILSSNSSVNVDEDGNYEDWVEIFNASTQSISLENYGLSDNENLFKWVFPNKIIHPGEYVLVYCSDKNKTNPDFPLHSNFKISADGETITLTSPSGSIEDQVPAIAIPSNVSYGRLPNGSSDFSFFNQPTPGRENFQSSTTDLSAPQFSVNSGFYDTNFVLTLSHPDSDATIIYTLDGSEPSVENLSGKTYFYKNNYPEFPDDAFGELIEGHFSTETYSGPIEITDRSGTANKISTISTTFNQSYYLPYGEIFKGNVVRAKAIKEGAESSEIITKNYFVSPLGANRFSLPIVSISLDENLFFDYEKGIHVAGKKFDDWRTENPDEDNLHADANYEQSGSNWEVPAHFSYFDQGTEKLNQDIAIRINGGFTRRIPNKSLRLYAKGNSYFNYKIFENSNYSNFKRLILRNSGNDAYSTYFRDAFIQKTVAHLHIDTQSYQPTVAFINGEYWGLLNFRERYDKKYFKRVYNIEEDELDFLEYNGYLVQEGDYQHYDAMLNFLQNNSLSENQNFEYVKTQMDTENFTDYFITNIFARNTDWPHNNIEFFRKRTDAYQPNAPYGQDGRWRWVLKDTDFGFGADGGENAFQHNTLAFATSTGDEENPNGSWSTLIFRKLLENESFKNDFINRYADMLNTTYLPARVTAIIDEMKDKIKNEILEHGKRWGSFNSIDSWEENINTMTNFAAYRPEIQRQHITQKFRILGEMTATLKVSDSNNGYIKINTIAINSKTPGVEEEPYPWTGIYFKNIPVKLKAIPLEGYKFSHWSGASNQTEDEITLITTSSFEITAHFVPDDNPKIPIYFWTIDTSIENNFPLTSILSSYEILGKGVLNFQSSLEGYPFHGSHPNWRKASMERRNSPTDLNYIPEANNNLAFENSDMKGLQIKQPFKNGNLENTLVYNFSTSGYKNIAFGFAAKDEGAAEGILVDYSIVQGEPSWTSSGLNSNILLLNTEYEKYNIDFSSIKGVNDNPDFKIRLRFTGQNRTEDNGKRVTFNNFSVSGSQNLAIETSNILSFQMYPNPVNGYLNIIHHHKNVEYKIITIEGKLIKKGLLEHGLIDFSELSTGMYILQLSSNGRSKMSKIIKA